MSTLPPFRENVDLKNHCTYAIGGPARYFLEVRSIPEMQEAIRFCSSKNIPFLILGKGSNSLFDDRGYPGAVLINKIDFMNELSPGRFHVGAGYSFALLGVQTARQGWGGLEFASGIPASVGGAVWMNAGANGCETAQALESVDFIQVDGTLLTYPRSELAYAYRHSPFQEISGAIVAATFALTAKSDARKLQIEIVNTRIKSQPYADKSAGCVFMNPAGNHAGALIDRCGLKGFSVGGASVSSMHANFLINAKEATCADMLALIKTVRQKVLEQTGIELQSEVRYIPFENTKEES